MLHHHGTLDILYACGNVFDRAHWWVYTNLWLWPILHWGHYYRHSVMSYLECLSQALIVLVGARLAWFPPTIAPPFDHHVPLQQLPLHCVYVLWHERIVLLQNYSLAQQYLEDAQCLHKGPWRRGWEVYIGGPHYFTSLLPCPGW